MIKIKRSDDKQFYFVVVAKNGQVRTTSETYKTRYGVKKAIVNHILEMYDLVEQVGSANISAMNITLISNVVDEAKKPNPSSSK